MSTFPSATFTATLSSTNRALGDYIGGDILNVKSFGAVGDGNNDDTGAIQACLDSAFGSTSAPHALNGTLNRGVFFPPGDYKTTSALNVREVNGCIIFGSGKGVSKIRNVTSGSIVFGTDGFAWSSIRNISFISAGGAGSICFDWGWNRGVSPDVGNFETTYINVEFNGGERGFRSGYDGGSAWTSQGSEALFIGCEFLNCSLYGLEPMNFNSLNHLIYGGRAENCTNGFFTTIGSIPHIEGVSFASNSDCDVVHSQGNTPAMVGCTSVSQNFVRFGPVGALGYIVGCNHNGTAGGYFSNSGANVVIDGCYSANGNLQTGSTTVKVYLRNCQFDSSTYLDSFSGNVAENI